MLIHSKLIGFRYRQAFQIAMFSHGKASLSELNRLQIIQQFQKKCLAQHPKQLTRQIESATIALISLIVAVIYSLKKRFYMLKNHAISGICAKYLITEKIHYESAKDKLSGEQHVCYAKRQNIGTN